MLINGRRVPIVGRVSMDMITVDLGPAASDKVGTRSPLWGRVAGGTGGRKDRHHPPRAADPPDQPVHLTHCDKREQMPMLKLA